MHRHWEPEQRGVWLLVTKLNVTKGNKLLGTEQKKTRRKKEGTSPALLPDDRFTDAVLDFLRATRVGEVKEGAIGR